MLALGTQKPEGTAFPSQLHWNVTFFKQLIRGCGCKILRPLPDLHCIGENIRLRNMATYYVDSEGF
jgi:hypothetical protein